ncbi:TolC family protein [Flavobacterium sp. NRK F10]|uniref:TolC family protein n=1 Tax=Flavobacterium sediminis TaxID=2201181 RepID=A0A2U8QS15_9FLAO|nr:MULTISPECIES: TolC family protein [Flavobacterium]AWM12938.1 TolC family protein [Flavobacterium sediminis]MCO6174075.1 TolC family protein [Flavobacterium sp. NRK F10]
MKRYLLLLVPFFTLAQEKVSLRNCYDEVEKNYPVASQYELLAEKGELETSSINKAKLPKLDVNAQATYQSDVTKMPISLPGVTVDPLNKDQYKATLDAYQLLYNGGFVKANANLKQAQTKVAQQQVAVTLYQLKAKVNQLYFTVLLLQERVLLLQAKKEWLQKRIEEVKVGVKHGALLPSSEQVLQAEVLKINQQIIELNADKQKNIETLKLLTGISISTDSQFEIPTESTQSVEGIRPEITLFNLQSEQLDFTKKVITKSRFPKISAFAQLGYGNPGLNMLKNSFETFYMTGLKLNWNVFDWNKTKTDKKVLDIAKNIVSTEQETFELNQKSQLQETEKEIQKAEALLQSDEEIIDLRTEIAQASEAQMKHGVITTADYLVEVTNLFDAKNTKKIHEVQLALTKANYNVIKGN